MGIYSWNNVSTVLTQVKFTSDKKEYALIKLDRSSYKQLMVTLSSTDNEFVEVILDKEELSLLVETKRWEQLSTQFQSQGVISPLAIITCETKIEQVTGFLFATSSVLALNNIGVYVQGAYTTDHIFVDYLNLDKALTVLSQLQK
jgi:hypothetical protein